MSSHNLKIPEFGKKLELLLRTGVKGIKTASALCKRLDISPDYLSRMKKGTRTVPDEMFSKLCSIYEVSENCWFDSLETFGKSLGLSSIQISSITGDTAFGIDFNSRITDKRIISDIHKVISGYWYSYYYSVSRIGELFVSKDLCIIKDINSSGFIECEIIDSSFRYFGVCFPIKGMLYFILEKDELFNEIIVYTTNLPDRIPPKLNGVILCLSGGVDELSASPSASKVAFRYIGKSEEIHNLFNIGTLSPDEYMRKNIPAYLSPKTDIEPEMLEVYKAIDNQIAKDSIPYALRAT
ncbi:MAG: helix-turn-helix domain-containing protein [Coleofasciculaceae cyanobacterium RL_1_1]|nr:helix-turn-helix domain-containing protein [Coleofasciculaceae cyanobacterium RL_1_1]